MESAHLQSFAFIGAIADCELLIALTEIPFPRNDNLCTRFATEISLRRANTNSLTIKVIPDDTRSTSEQANIKAFEESITDFDDLPRIMDLAMTIMGIDTKPGSDSAPQAFARDVLSIIIEGPSRPQLTLVDIPGLIATHTKGTTSADVDLVAEITDRYISQQRTICLAVVSATSDYANQKILEKVREVDPKGERTLGIITKPDRLDAGSGSEKSFIELANNDDVFFQLGWHVLKNRSYDQRDFQLQERNLAEDAFFRTSNFKVLAPESRGIDALRRRLALLLFQHVKKELPKLKEDLEIALFVARDQLALLGNRRSTVSDCKSYLAQLSLDYYEILKAAVNGHYEGSYFHNDIDYTFSLESPSSVRRTRAVVQMLNNKFSDTLRKKGHKYQISMNDDAEEFFTPVSLKVFAADKKDPPKPLTKQEALYWVRRVLSRTRGKELPGNFNPLLIGELFWEQSSKWGDMAKSHVEDVSQICVKFLRILLHDKCPEDVETRIWTNKIEDALRTRTKDAFRELDLLMQDLAGYPINYNHYYTDTINKRRQDRQKAALTRSIKDATTETFNGRNQGLANIVDIEQAVASYSHRSDPDMENFSCGEALDCLFAIYKVSSPRFLLG